MFKLQTMSLLSLGIEALCSHLQSEERENGSFVFVHVARSYHDARLLASESWDQLAVSPMIICRFDFSSLATVFIVRGNGI